ncbi:hypothetical protein ACIQ1D_06715 [Lysinibacillus xylanilyticus]
MSYLPEVGVWDEVHSATLHLLAEEISSNLYNFNAQVSINIEIGH